MEEKIVQFRDPEKADQVFKLVLLVVVLLALLFVGVKLTSNGKKVVSQDKHVAPIQRSEVNLHSVPERFPASIPIEAKANIVQNFNATTPSGQFQATRAFETKASLADNLTLYTNFMGTDGWKISSKVDQPTYKMIFGSKDNKTLQVSIEQNTISKINTVSISYVETNKK